MVYKQRKSSFIDVIFNLQNCKMGDNNSQMGKDIKGENGQIGE